MGGKPDLCNPVAAAFTPTQDRYRGQVCQGVRLLLLDRDALDAGRLGVELESALRRLHGDRFEIDRTLSLIGDRRVLAASKAGADPLAIGLEWRAPERAFLPLRQKYLLYE